MNNYLKKTIYLIDISHIIYKSYYVYKKYIYNNKKKKKLSYIYFFLKMFLSFLNLNNPKYVIVVFDSSKNNIRYKYYKKYKKNRAKTPKDLLNYLKYLRNIINGLGLCIIKKNNYEADDIIATLVKYLSNKNKYNIFIVSSDKDMLQLVRDNVFIYDINKHKKKIIDNKNIICKYNMLPNNLVDLFAIIGNKINNIPGIKGIGIKRGIKLINKYKNVENIMKNIYKLDNYCKYRFNKQKNEIFMYKKLVTLINNVPI